jgi:GAF domain-containing protein
MSLVAWRVSSIFVFCVAFLLAILSFDSGQIAPSKLVLIVAPLALCAVAFLHTKFLLSTRKRYRISKNAPETAFDLRSSKRDEMSQPVEDLVSTREILKEAEMLRRATVALSTHLRMNPVLDNLLDILYQQIPFETAQVLLFETDKRLFLARESVRSDRLPAHPETIDLSVRPMLHDALSRSAGLVIADTLIDKSSFATKPGEPIRSWLGVPLLASSLKIGILCAGHSLPNQFTAGHLRVAHSLAPAVAVAVQNARIAERLAICTSELKNDFKATRQFRR